MSISWSSVILALGTKIWLLRSNIQATQPSAPMLPPFLEKAWRSSLTVRLRLSVATLTSTAAPPGPYPSNMTSSICPPSSSPVPRMMAFLMLSEGMLTALAASTAVRRRGFPSGSPPLRAAIIISLMMRVNDFPRLASSAAFLCLMVAHLEWPDMMNLARDPAASAGSCKCYEFNVLRIAESGNGVKRELDVDGGGIRLPFLLGQLAREEGPARNMRCPRKRGGIRK